MKKLKFLLTMLSMLLLASCGAKNEKIKDKDYDKVDIIFNWYPTASSTFLYVAKEKGYFEEEGIRVKLHMPSGTTDPLALIAAKKADIGYFYMHRTIMAEVNEELPIKAIGTIMHGSVNTVMSLKKSNIKRPKDLEGKTLGYCGGPLNEEIIYTMMIADGGNPKKVKLIDIGFELLTSLITEKVDATLGGLETHEVPLMREKGYEINYFKPIEYGIPNHPEDILIANDEMIENRKDVYKKFLRASSKAFIYMKENPEGAMKILLKNQAKEQFPLDEKVEMQGLNILLPIMEKEGRPFLSIDEKSWEENIRWLYEKGFIKEKTKASDMFINLM